MAQYLEAMSLQELLALACLSTTSDCEKYCNCSSALLKEFKSSICSEDIMLAMKEIYKTLMKPSNQEIFIKIINQFLIRLDRETNDPFDCIFKDMECIQEILAKALWGYNLSLQSELETFAREFDRIDDIGFRRRLLQHYHGDSI